MTNKQFRVIVGGELDASQHVAGIVLVDANGDPISIGGGAAVTWANISGKPAVVAAGADAPAARAAIGAGTSSIALGSTASTASPGNHAHAASAVTATAIAPGTATNVQGILAELAARIAALEAA
ncbi:hypothetical protein DEU38_13430 [Rhodococcus sp. AG1013]|uniref:hypothetical protein n=1 Tax=Rhodococcus sp. AG1013 TaxID=2183996 RepID=UPI000E0B1A41|nr:hypothetical protein [Rhodococcus sp. AG1013]RDI13455.1 hypothetical protein DEU38_13430 [Rhodococcus sp. AG1013]